MHWVINITSVRKASSLTVPAESKESDVIAFVKLSVIRTIDNGHIGFTQNWRAIEIHSILWLSST